MAALPGTWSTDYKTVPLTEVAQSRRTTAFIPQNGQSQYNVVSGTRIYIQLSGADLIDPEASYVELSLSVSAPAARGGDTTCGGLLLPNSIESLVQRIVIRAGGELERIDNSNLLETAQNQIYMNSDAV